MKQLMNKPFFAIALSAVIIGFCAWIPTGKTFENRYVRYDENHDTTPKKKYRYDRDLSEEDLDKALKSLDKATFDVDQKINIDFSKMEKQMKEAMTQLNNIDFAKLNRDIEESLKKIDWEKTRRETDRALRQAELQLKQVDMDKLRSDVEKAMKEVDAQKIASNINFESLQKTINTSLAGAKLGIQKAKEELTRMKEFINILEKDGLIDKKKGYSIEVKDGDLYINGTKQSKEVTDKYRKYFGEEDYKIKSDAEGSIRL